MRFYTETYFKPDSGEVVDCYAPELPVNNSPDENSVYYSSEFLHIQSDILWMFISIN